jgi:ornithine carbamoyltransferase
MSSSGDQIPSVFRHSSTVVDGAPGSVSFLKEIDFTPGELRYLLQLAGALKLAKYAGTEVKQLDGREIALVLEKTSTRTRSAFEVAAYDQGAHCDLP